MGTPNSKRISAMNRDAIEAMASEIGRELGIGIHDAQDVLINTLMRKNVWVIVKSMAKDTAKRAK